MFIQMKLPETNPTIKDRLSIDEISSQIKDGDYSAELLLQHLVLNYNVLLEDRNRLQSELKQSIDSLKHICNEIDAPVHDRGLVPMRIRIVSRNTKCAYKI
jgi:hypothetical protein